MGIGSLESIFERACSKRENQSAFMYDWPMGCDYQTNGLMPRWVTSLKRKERKLTLTSDVHKYDKPGKYRILVKVIDIFSNGTSQAFDVEVPLT